MSVIRTLIADDHDVVRAGLKATVNEIAGHVVVGEARNGAEVLAKVGQLGVDLVIMDIAMPGRSGLEILAEIKRSHPKIAVLIFSMHGEEEFALRALRLGAAGYVTKTSSLSEVGKAIRTIARGRRHVSPSLAQLMITEMNSPGDGAAHETLSGREDKIMRSIAEGKSLTKIATELSISAKTVSTYRMRILEKMKLKNNADLTRYLVSLQLDSKQTAPQSRAKR